MKVKYLAICVRYALNGGELTKFMEFMYGNS